MNGEENELQTLEHNSMGQMQNEIAQNRRKRLTTKILENKETVMTNIRQLT